MSKRVKTSILDNGICISFSKYKKRRDTVMAIEDNVEKTYYYYEYSYAQKNNGPQVSYTRGTEIYRIKIKGKYRSLTIDDTGTVTKSIPLTQFILYSKL